MGEQFSAEVTREVLEFSMDRGFVAPEFPVLVEDEPAFVAFYVQLFPFVDIGLVFLRRKIEFTIGIMMVKNNAQMAFMQVTFMLNSFISCVHMNPIRINAVRAFFATANESG